MDILNAFTKGVIFVGVVVGCVALWAIAGYLSDIVQELRKSNKEWP
jgi:hypothetical protein